MNRSVIPAFLILIALVLSAGHVFAAAPVEVRMNYSAPVGEYTPVWVAQEDGFLAKYGIKTELKLMRAPTGVQGLIGKSLDIGNVGPELIEARLGGADVVYIGALANRFIHSLYVKPELRSLQDLKGKVVGTTQPGSTPHVAIRILLQKGGLFVGRDVRVVHFQGGGVTEAFLQGAVDAAVLPPPLTLRAKDAGFREILNMSLENYPMVLAGIAATRAFIKEHPEVIRSYLQAILEALKAARSDAKRTKEIIGKYTQTANAQDLEETYRVLSRVWEKIPFVSAAAVQTALEFSTHPAARTAKPDSFFDNSFLAELERSGFVEHLYRP